MNNKTLFMNTEFYDRAEEVKQFEDAKIGVKGLVDSGITKIPRIFIHPPDTLYHDKPKSKNRLDSDFFPIIDLAGINTDQRRAIVQNIARASRELGFFQIVNHGIGVDVLERVMRAVKGFHELPTEVKAQFYRRDMSAGISFYSNLDVFHSIAACWRDTLQIRLSPPYQSDEIPEICRKEVEEWNHHVKQLGEILFGLLCEGLGLETEMLKEMTFTDGRMMVGNCYPYCPQPELTVGIASHTDPGALAILLPDDTSGLQVKCGEDWVDVRPVPGALVINIGDLLQILSNDEYISVEHRGLANPSLELRASVVVFFSPGERNRLFGPLPGLISTEKPALFRQFTHTDYIKRFQAKKIDGKTLVNFYRL